MLFLSVKAVIGNIRQLVMSGRGQKDGENRKTPMCFRNCMETWVGKIPWRREWLPTLAFLPGESLGQRSLVGYSPWTHS